MSRINTNVGSLIAQNALVNNQNSLSTSLQRLSTGLRINSGADDPSGLIASQSLQATTASLNAAISNASSANQILSTADGGLSSVGSLLTQLQGLITSTANSAGLSTDQKNANQLQVDSILQSIDRASAATTFQGKNLLDGTLGYTTNTVNAGVTNATINSAKLAGGQNVAVQVNVIASAQKAGLYLSLGGNLNLNATNSSFTIQVAGALGSRQLSFSSGTHASAITAAINTFTQITGVAATSSGTAGVVLKSSDYGSSQFVSVKTIDAASIQGTGVGIYNLNATNNNAANTTIASTFANATNGVRATGQDISATINGQAATGNGTTASISTDFLDISLNLNTASGNNKAQTTGTFNALTITGGGANFQLASQVNIGGLASIGINNVSTSSLGDSTLGFLSSLGSGNANALNKASDLSTAQNIVSEAINQVSSLRGRIGAFQTNIVGSTTQNLNIALQNTQSAESNITDANFASETANLTRNQILVQAATSALKLANSNPQSVLSLLQ